MSKRKPPLDPAVSEYMAGLARRRHEQLGPDGRRASASRASRAYWAALTAEQRSAEMKRRRRLGLRRRGLEERKGKK